MGVIEIEYVLWSGAKKTARILSERTSPTVYMEQGQILSESRPKIDYGPVTAVMDNSHPGFDDMLRLKDIGVRRLLIRRPHDGEDRYPSQRPAFRVNHCAAVEKAEKLGFEVEIAISEKDMEWPC